MPQTEPLRPPLVIGAMLSMAFAQAIAAPLSVTVLDASGSPLANAVVSLEVAGGKPTAPPGTLAEMGQRERSFVPSLLVVQTGTAVSFPNFDTVRHHIYSFSPTKPFEIKLYAGTPAAPVVFDKAGTAILGCNIHDRMTAFIHVVNTAHFAITNQAGVAKLDVPAGDHTLQVWHMQMGDKQLPQRQGLKVQAAGGTRVVQLGSASKP